MSHSALIVLGANPVGTGSPHKTGRGCDRVKRQSDAIPYLVERFHETAHNKQNVFTRPPHPTQQAGRGSETPCEHHLYMESGRALPLPVLYEERVG
jgi:hypothetical protein